MFEAEISSVPFHYIPEEITWSNYAVILGYQVETIYGTVGPSGYAPAIIRGLVNSIIVSLPATVLALLISIPVGYAFARYVFPRKNTLLMILLFSRALPPISIVIPYFIFFKTIGLLGSTYGLSLIYLTITVPLSVWILTGFFSTLPIEIEKAARVDGCGRMRALLRVTIPMASSGIAAVGILIFLLCWNEFLFAYILTNGTPAQTLPPVLPGMLTTYHVYNNELAAAAVLSIIPPILIGALFGRYIIRLKIVDPLTIGG